MENTRTRRSNALFVNPSQVCLWSPGGQRAASCELSAHGRENLCVRGERELGVYGPPSLVRVCCLAGGLRWMADE